MPERQEKLSQIFTSEHIFENTRTNENIAHLYHLHVLFTAANSHFGLQKLIESLMWNIQDDQTSAF